MRIKGYNRLRISLTRIANWLNGFALRIFNAKKLPSIPTVSVKRFRLNNHEAILIVIEGLALMPGTAEINELIVKAGRTQMGSFMLNPSNNNFPRTSGKTREFSFSYFALVPENQKKIRIITKKTSTTICRIDLTHIEILPYADSENGPRFLYDGISTNISKSNYRHDALQKPEASPLKVLLVTHNLNIEGAPKVLLEIAKGLKANPNFSPTVLSFYDGPLSADVRNLNIPLIIISGDNRNNNFCSIQHEQQQRNYLSVIEILKIENPDVIFANTIINSIVVSAAHSEKIPCIWMIHESNYPAANQNMQAFCSQSKNLKAFLLASRIVFCSQSTMKIYEQFDFNQCFKLIHNAADDKFKSLILNPKMKTEARQKLNIPEKALMLLNVGVIHENKNQLLIVNALKHTQNRNILLYLVGAKPGYPYQEKLHETISADDLTARVMIVPEQKDIMKYYLAADIYILPSLSESYPLTILEAMACGLPILTTPVYGVNEQVKFGENALSISPDDEIDLARKIEFLTDDDGKRLEMGNSSRTIFDNMPDHEAMVNDHAQVILSAWKERKL